MEDDAPDRLENMEQKVAWLEARDLDEVLSVPPVFHMDSTGLFPQLSPPKYLMTGVEWSGVESTGLDSPCGVHRDWHG